MEQGATKKRPSYIYGFDARPLKDKKIGATGIN
jgi:hypothetical protein